MGGSNPGGKEIFSAAQTDPEAYPVSCTTVTEPFQAEKQPERCANHLLKTGGTCTSSYFLCLPRHVMGRPLS
jgi:hypothetical protein